MGTVGKCHAQDDADEGENDETDKYFKHPLEEQNALATFSVGEDNQCGDNESKSGDDQDGEQAAFLT